MKPYQIVGVIATSTAVVAGFVAFLVTQGMSIFAAFLCVYALALAFMLSAQSGARQEAIDEKDQRMTENNREHAKSADVKSYPLDQEQRRQQRFGA